MPPIRTFRDPRSSLMVCDGCDAVMSRDGTPTTKTHRECDPDDLAPHYMPYADATATAASTGWLDDGDGRWSCPPCSSKRAPTAT